VRVLFDQGTPVPLRNHLPHHTIRTAFELGWSGLMNGELLTRAEAEGFEALVTTDRNLKYQQNLSDRRIAIVVLSTTSWPRIQASVSVVLRAIDSAVPGGYAEVSIP
jgi:hypothetical protein